MPLSQIARLNYEYEEPILWRRNRDIVLTVRGDIVDGVQPPDVSNEIAPKLQSIKDALPYGYRIETGGSIEESAKANVALAAVFPVMAVVMLALLMIQLQSFSRLALVFVTAPLGLIGATGALLIAGQPFGFVALLGLIALAGMIMRNTVILVDQIDTDIAAGHARYQAIIDATVRRARPVVLTALAAILGMIPLARSVFWGPMAITIMGGLLVATVLTLAGRAGALRALVPGAARRGCGGAGRNRAGARNGAAARGGVDRLMLTSRSESKLAETPACAILGRRLRGTERSAAARHYRVSRAMPAHASHDTHRAGADPPDRQRARRIARRRRDVARLGAAVRRPAADHRDRADAVPQNLACALRQDRARLGGAGARAAGARLRRRAHRPRRSRMRCSANT